MVLDLGLAVPAGPGPEGAVPGAACGTVLYGAPEQTGGLPHGYKADVWSIGSVAFVLLAGRNAFAAAGEREEDQRVAASLGDYAFSPEHRPSEEAQAFVAACLNPDPRARPHARDLLAHPWLARAAAALSRRLGADAILEPGARRAAGAGAAWGVGPFGTPDDGAQRAKARSRSSAGETASVGDEEDVEEVEPRAESVASPVGTVARKLWQRLSSGSTPDA